MKKKFFTFALALTLAVLCAQASYCFVSYPSIGTCTGANVNLRNKPGTSGTKVVGKLEEYQFVVVLGSRRVNGTDWYQIDDPEGGEGSTAWISGRYLDTFDDGSQYFRMHAAVMQRYGSSPARSRKLMGRPTNEKREEVETNGGELAGDVFTTIRYGNNLTLGFFNKSLTYVYAAERGDYSFGPIAIGDPARKLVEYFGREPDGVANGVVTYGNEMMGFDFAFTGASDSDWRSGTIVQMRYHEEFIPDDGPFGGR